MIPVNGKPVIGWILEDLVARGMTEIILVLRFDNHKLYNYVEWAYGKRIRVYFAFVQPGGTILHSLLSGLAWVQPGWGVHIVLGDTLIQDVYPAQDDFVFAGPYENPEDWCLVEKDPQGNAAAYYDKMQLPHNGLQALAGVYSLSDTALLRNLMVEGIKRGSKEISTVLLEYGNVRPIKVVETKAWYDFGHIHYFNLAKRKLLQSRYFNSLLIDPVHGTITKKSEKKDKLADELAWYSALPAHLQLLSPRLFQTGTPDAVTITQEYYGYPNLAELYVFSDLGLSVWMSAVKRLLEIHKLFKLETGPVSANDVLQMYGEKTRQRLDELRKHENWKSILGADRLMINDRPYRNFKILEEQSSELIQDMGNRVQGCIIHGDYCFSNILYDLNSQLVKLIDPRGSFGEQKLYGDPRYDMAKLRHSVSGRYDFIIAGLFYVEQKTDGFVLNVFKPDTHDSLTAFFDTLLAAEGYSVREIRFIEALLFISMVPLHEDNAERQLALYLNGVMILNTVFEL